MAICVVSMIGSGCYCDLPEAAVCVSWLRCYTLDNLCLIRTCVLSSWQQVTVCRRGDVNDVCLAAWEEGRA